MALLSDADRADITAKIQRLHQWAGIPCPISKPELRDAVNTTDAWQDGAQASYNTNLPTPARTLLNLTQKTLIFCAVAMKRAGIL